MQKVSECLISTLFILSLCLLNLLLSRRKRPSSSEQLGRGKVSSCRLQGRRRTQEDFLGFEELPLLTGLQTDNDLLLLVCDGHGGSRCSEYIYNNFLCKLTINKEKLYADPASLLTETFLGLDSDFVQLMRASAREREHEGRASGSTATAVALLNQTLVTANVGDSAAVLVKRSGEFEVLTQEHRLENPDEEARVRALKGLVMKIGNDCKRLGGVLAVSRSFGDIHFKKWVTAEPSISSRIVGEEDLALVVASDGLWDFVGYGEAVDVVVGEFAEGNAEGCAAVLGELAVEEKKGSDNVSVIVVDLRGRNAKMGG